MKRRAARAIEREGLPSTRVARSINCSTVGSPARNALAIAR